ncbi:MAG: hypothetical protein JNL52_05690 [Flavobacteriales bacterium]|nr:hypothetical protein [Flavobacteriales bacterium]
METPSWPAKVILGPAGPRITSPPVMSGRTLGKLTALVKLFRAHGITVWRRHYAIEGKPDFAFPKQKLVLFVDGCFWHGCPKHATQPKGNAVFWSTKLAANKARDRKVNRELRSKS